MNIEDLGFDEGMEDIPELTQIALVDADTLVYAVCSVCEYSEELLPREMYLEEEYEQLLIHPNYDKETHSVWKIDLDVALDQAKAKVIDLQMKTRTAGVELYFTSGKNFRHTVDPMYKANRTSTRYPVGLLLLKELLLETYPGKICEGIEADDVVVYLKRTQPEKYVLCAVDKDVYKSVPGKHWNYYQSEKYGIAPKWVDILKEDAEKFPYLQTLMGDSTDNIRGCPGIGPKKAESALAKVNTPKEMWAVVVKLFKSKGLTEKDAIRAMRLVNMHQIDHNYQWVPWIPPM